MLHNWEDTITNSRSGGQITMRTNGVGPSPSDEVELPSSNGDESSSSSSIARRKILRMRSVGRWRSGEVKFLRQRG